MVAAPTTDTIGALQDLLLECLMNGRPLPGRDHPLMFPDLAYLTAGDATLVAAADYYGGLSTVSVDSEDRLADRAGGMTGYARFTPIDQPSWPLTVRLQVVLPFPDVDPLVVGEVIATFEPVEDRAGGTSWTTVEPTHVLAT